MFCLKTGRTATETFQLKKHAYGDNAVPHTCVFFKWYARFWGGLENLEDKEGSGRPTVVRTTYMSETVREFISTDREMTLRMINRKSKLTEKQFAESQWKMSEKRKI
jgi:hypothetical protein